MFFSKKDKQRSELIDMLSTAGTLGTQIVISTFIGAGMGWYLDKHSQEWFGVATGPWGMIVFLLLGIVAGFRTCFQEIQKIQRLEEERSKAKQELLGVRKTGEDSGNDDSKD